MRWLLLDVGGVLADVDDAVWPRRFETRWAERLGLAIEDYAARIRAANLPEATLRDDVEEEYWRGYGAAVGADEEVLAAMRADFWDACCGEPNRELLAFLRTTAGRVPMAILSTSGDGARRDRARFGFSALFAPICYSHELGVAKPEAAAFRAALTAMGAAPQDVLFVDNAPRCVAAAGSLGMRTVLHESNDATIEAIREWTGSAGPDPLFADPRLAEVYDAFDAPRGDLAAYDAMVDELGAASVLDVGCGTGSLAVRLAGRGVDVTGIDPAAASLEVAHAKPFAARVRWVRGDATAVPAIRVDLAMMTGNVAQVFLTDAAWHAALTAVRGALAPGGHLVFETRRPESRVWEDWAGGDVVVHDVAGVGRVEQRRALESVDLPFVSFRHDYHFVDDGTTLDSHSTLRFRTLAELEAGLTAAGFRVHEVRDAPDRPGREYVVLATAT